MIIDTQFPKNPIIGQQYIDQYNVEWIYTVENEWVVIGPIINIPVARSGQQCQS